MNNNLQRALLIRILLVVGLLALIGGAIVVAANSTREAPHQLDASGGHDHDGDGKPDH